MRKKRLFTEDKLYALFHLGVIVITLLMLGLLCESIQADEPRNEVEWSQYLAEQLTAQGERVTTEYRLPDGSRVDIYDGSTCWEVEWTGKWEQAFGQAAFYAASTGEQAGIWLLKRPEDDEDYLRCLTTLYWYRSQGCQIQLRVQLAK